MTLTPRLYPTWTAWLAHVAGPSDMPDDERSSRSDDSHFTNTSTFDEAVTLARHGWREGAAMTRRYAQALTTRIVGRVEREDLVYDVEGMGYDVARLLDNVPEHWQRWQATGEHEDRAGNRLIRVIMNGSASWSVPTRTIIARGAAACALVELLEYAGARVQFDVVWTALPVNYEKSPQLTHRVTVKKYSAPLDLGTVAFAAAHPSALRRLVFAAEEREAEGVRHLFGIHRHGGYGMPTELPLDEQRGALYIPCASSADADWSEANAAERWIVYQLGEQGVRLCDAVRSVRKEA